MQIYWEITAYETLAIHDMTKMFVICYCNLINVNLVDIDIHVVLLPLAYHHPAKQG